MKMKSEAENRYNAVSYAARALQGKRDRLWSDGYEIEARNCEHHLLALEGIMLELNAEQRLEDILTAMEDRAQLLEQLSVPYLWSIIKRLTPVASEVWCEKYECTVPEDAEPPAIIEEIRALSIRIAGKAEDLAENRRSVSVILTDLWTGVPGGANDERKP